MSVQNEAQNEVQFVVKIWHGGNQYIDEFYEKNENGDVNYMKKQEMILHNVNPKTILDVKKVISNSTNHPINHAINTANELIATS